MNSANGMVAGSGGTMEMARRAASVGVKVAAAQAVDAEIVAVVRGAFGERAPEFLSTPLGEKAAQVAVPMFLHWLASTYPELVPGADRVRAGCDYAIQGVARDAVGPLLQLFTPLMNKMASLAEAAGPEAVSPADAVVDATQDVEPRVAASAEG